MKILILHEPYHGATPGGEDHVVRRQHAILAARGVATRLLEWPPPLASASAVRKGLVQLRAAYSTRSRRRVRAEIAAFQPDIVHVHNFWPQLTPSVHYECRRAGIPVVQTLHNYRMLCVADFLLRDGNPCELCLGKSLWQGVRHRCDRKSLTRSVLKAAAFTIHRALDTWNDTVDMFIAPSVSMRDRYVRSGIHPSRIVVHPQCAPDPGPGAEERHYFAFVGRLSPEKGIDMLLDVWGRLGNAELRIAGGGALEARVRDVAARLPNVRYLGALAAEPSMEVMRGAIATVVPSLWEEPFPLVIAESYAAATPVIAADTGSRAETVVHEKTGLVFPAGNAAALERSLRWAADHPGECREMGRAARARYEAQHSAEASYARLLSTYESVLRTRRAHEISRMSPDQQYALFVERGWLTIDLPDPGVVRSVRDRLLDHLRSTALPDLERLEDYHAHVEDEDRHIANLYDLARFYWRAGLGTTLIASHMSFFRQFVGLDLHVQKYPYLRAVRPGRAADAVPLHRDTYYGSSPYEVAVFIPFTDVASDSLLRVLTGSHLEPDAAYPWTAGSSSGVTPGSPRHQLGFPYAPKRLDPALVARCDVVPLRVGQALLFSLALVHGSGTNAGPTTRFSTDIRVVNSLAPIEWSHSVHADYYVPLCSSPVTLQAQRYLAHPSAPQGD